MLQSLLMVRIIVASLEQLYLLNKRLSHKHIIPSVSILYDAGKTLFKLHMKEAHTVGFVDFGRLT